MWLYLHKPHWSFITHKPVQLLQNLMKTLPENNTHMETLAICHCSQGFEAWTQILGSGSSSRHVYGLAPAPTYRSFWLRIENALANWIIKVIVFFVQLACPTKRFCGTEIYCKFQVQVQLCFHHLKVVVSVPAQAIQNYFGSSSISLTTPHLIVHNSKTVRGKDTTNTCWQTLRCSLW